METTQEGGLPILIPIYRAAIDKASFKISVVSDSEIRLDEKVHTYDLTPLELGLYSLLLDGKTYTLQLVERPKPNHLSLPTESLSSDGANSFLIGAGGRQYRVKVDDERSWLLRSFLSKVHPTTGTTTVRAPMPGLILRVEVKHGERVVQGQGLIVLEAMKMENEIRSLTAGTVKEIHVDVGKPVEKGEPLVTVSED
jgi:pyruvate carboxylase subunit B